MKKVIAKQANLLFFSCQLALCGKSTSDVSDRTCDDVTQVKGRAVGRCNNSFSLLFFADT